MSERHVNLSFSQQEARIVPERILGGYALEIGGIEQSHVDLEDPTVLRHEYLRRLAHIIDTCWPAGEPISILHLGGGALTLARYVQATRPGSIQTVIEIERELPGFVIDELPLPEGTRLDVVIGDAAEQLHALPDGTRFDVIVSDVFSGHDTPEHLATPDFHAECLRRLSKGGALIVNVGDDPPLTFYARQARALEEVTAQRGLPGPWTLTDASLLTLTTMGNMVVAAGDALSRFPADELRARWIAAGPHPAAALDPDGTATLVERILGPA